MWTKGQADSNSWSVVHRPDTFATAMTIFPRTARYKQFNKIFKSQSTDVVSQIVKM